MRSSLLFALSIFLAFLPVAQAKSPRDGSVLFVAAYVKAEEGEKAAREGNFEIALSTLHEAARMLDKVPAKFRDRNAAIVKYLNAHTAASIARVQDQIANSRSVQNEIADSGSNGFGANGLPKNWKEVKSNGRTSYYIVLCGDQ